MSASDGDEFPLGSGCRGPVVEVEYKAGETKHLKYAPGEFAIHDLKNVGDTELLFTTVEFKDSANTPLPLK